MTTTTQDPSGEWGRLAAVSSLVEVAAGHVNDLAPVDPEGLPEWLAILGLPAGWHLAHLEEPAAQPSRIAVLPPDGRGGLGCETISILGFTGVLPFDVIRDEADRTLRDLRATGINTQDVALPPVPGTIALRSSGYFNTAGLQVWAQHSTYVANYDKGRGLLILHGLFIESRSLERLRDNIIALSDAVHHAFLTAIAG
jgi:hypothetical protein